MLPATQQYSKEKQRCKELEIWQFPFKHLEVFRFLCFLPGQESSDTSFLLPPPLGDPFPLAMKLVNSHQRIIASLGTCSGHFRNWKECSSAPGNHLFLGIVSLQRCYFLPLLSSWPVPIIENFLLYSSESKAALSSRNEKIGSLLKERQGDVIPC